MPVITSLLYKQVGVSPDYYIVPGWDLRSDPAKFGKWFADLKDADDSSERPRRVSQQMESF